MSESPSRDAGVQALSIEAKIGTFVDLPGIESAIAGAAFAAKDAEGLTLLILQSHLKKLCKLQRTVLSVLDGVDA